VLIAVMRLGEAEAGRDGVAGGGGDELTEVGGLRTNTAPLVAAAIAKPENGPSSPVPNPLTSG
jgi:hypothetical protein